MRAIAVLLALLITVPALVSSEVRLWHNADHQAERYKVCLRI